MSTLTNRPSPLRIVAFVEGSNSGLRGSPKDHLHRLWASTLVQTLRLHKIERVVGVGKASIVACCPDMGLRRKSTAMREAIDEIMARELRSAPFDCALVAWDLLPPWDRETKACRREEILALYSGIGSSKHLPAEWKKSARARLAELKRRSAPVARQQASRPVRYSVLTLCMEWMFESMFMNERAVRTALGLVDMEVAGWPGHWSRAERGPDKLLQRAIVAAQRRRPLPDVFRRIHGDMHTAKHEWGTYLVGHSALRDHVARDRIGARLIELLGLCDGDADAICDL
jgi:hypothetical protein